MTNMEKVAEMLGVKIGEKFNIKNNEYNPYRIEHDGIIDCDGDSISGVLMNLIANESIIEKTEPELGQKDKIAVLSTQCCQCKKCYYNDIAKVVSNYRVFEICLKCLKAEYGVVL